MSIASLLRPRQPRLDRTASRHCLAFIENFEGFSATQYDDGTGVMTIGYGTTSADVSPLPRYLTQTQASRLLHHKLNEKYTPYIHALRVPLTQNQFDALVSFIYNLGPGVIGRGTTLYSLLKQRRFHAFADHILAYCHAGGRVMLGLQRRRRAERALFLRK